MLNDASLLSLPHQEREREYRRRERALIDDFAAAVRGSDKHLIGPSLSALAHEHGIWRRAIQSVEQLDPSTDFRLACLSIWVRDGGFLRGAIGNDLMLIKLLRVLLPRYRGPSVQLFRGDRFINRLRRTYGLSWSQDIEVARSFANGESRLCDGGSVLLATRAPTDAIVCAPAMFTGGHDGEIEFVVDRRRLRHVSVVERHRQETLKEFDARQAAAVA